MSATPLRLIPAVLTALLLAGCGPDRPETVQVTGTVLYGDQPVEGAEVVFMTGGRPAKGTTDAEGRFRLTTFDPGDGAIPGQHRVLITKREEMPDPNAPDSPYKITRDLLPSRYASTTQSTLTADVDPSKDNDFEFKLVD